MYTTANATREFALKAAAAAGRAMERGACCKSQFKFKCFSCGQMINRGDNITRCIRATTGMTLRYRGADATHGLTMGETTFYLGESGKDMWVHTGCIPCFWHDGLDEDGNRLTHPALRPITTEWGVKVYGEFEEEAKDDENLQIMGIPYFSRVMGYPKEKFMRDRIIRAVTRFQALWRGYIYKKAYPEALRTKKVNVAIKTKQYANKRNYFLSRNYLGTHVEILFDENHPSVALYSGEVVKVRGMPEIDGLYFWVKYHYDGEVRRYHWKKLMALKLQCEAFKSKHGILAQITGKLPLYSFFHP